MIRQTPFSSQSFLPSRYAIILSLGLLLYSASTAFCLPTTIGFIDAAKQTDAAHAPAVKKDNPDDRNLSDLIPKATALSEKQILMQSQLKAIRDTTGITEQLLAISEKRNHLQEKFTLLVAKPHANYQKLTVLQESLQETRRKAAATASSVNNSIGVLDKWIDFWSEEEKDLKNWFSGLGSSSALPAVQTELDRLLQTIQTSQETLDQRLLPLMEIQRKAGRLQVSIYDLHLQMQHLFENKFQHGIYKHAPFLFSSDFRDQFDTGLWNKTVRGLQRILYSDTDFLEKERIKIFAALLFFLTFLAILTSSTRYLKKSAHYQFIAKCPLSISFFITLIFFFMISAKMPAFWLAIYRILALISVIRISRVLIPNRLQKNFITRLSLLLLATNFLVIIDLPIPLTRLYIILVAFTFICFHILQKNKKEEKSKWLIWAQRLGIIGLTIILFAEINGQAELAFFIFVASLKTLSAFLFFWILYLIILVMLDLLLHHAPIQLLQNNSSAISKMIRPPLFTTGLLLLLSVVLVDWHLYSTAADAISHLSSFGINIGEGRISIGIILAALFLLYTAYGSSRIIQSILLQSVLPRKNVDKGVQLSITRLIHYSIMLIGFLLALQALGFSLTNLTILGGALGVGIGFGLQAIINNFASGLILLFERPIKVGDTIQVGEELAEVKELGLRATIVQTFDNAEIVLPNSDLITSQVTNWTLKERRVRVKIPVGVAYGSDVEKVLKILLDCANERPDILSTPSPSALFLAFGASSLDFELRVFIPEFTDRRRIHSELNIDINKEFADAGIEIPFPQSDLHLRSVDSGAAEALNKNSQE